jgi:hypothetical protein
MIGVQETLSELALIVTCTVPGLGVIDPESWTELPTVTDSGETLKEIDVDWMKFALTVTGLAGIVKVQGLKLFPLEHEAPVIVQVVNIHPGFAVAETEIGAP